MLHVPFRELRLPVADIYMDLS